MGIAQNLVDKLRDFVLKQKILKLLSRGSPYLANHLRDFSFSRKILKLFSRSPSSLLGIDINSSAIRLIELTCKEGRVCVESYAIEPLPPGTMAGNKIQDTEALAAAIKRAVKQSGTQARKVAAAVPSSEVITRTMLVPGGLSERELESQVELEAAQYIPYPLEEVNLDFEVQRISEKDPAMVEVLLVACRSEQVNTRISALKQAGLTPVIIGVEAHAIEHVFPLLMKQIASEGEGQTVAVMDIGATLTTINILHSGKIVYTREQDFGGNQIAEEMQRRYSLFCEEASLTGSQEASPDDYLSEVLESFKRIITQQVKFFFSSTQYNNLNHMVLAGEYSSIPGVDKKLIEATVGTTVSTANPFADMLLGSQVKAEMLGNDAPALVSACGLALRLKLELYHD